MFFKAFLAPARLAAFALLIAALFVTAAVAAPKGKGPIVIRDNRGGNVLEMIEYRHKLARSGRQVQIRGYCGSACTMLITLPNACLGPGATVGFHAPRVPGTNIIPPYVDDMMGSFYRNGILKRWNAGWKRQIKIQRISAAEYVRLDPETKLCPR